MMMIIIIIIIIIIVTSIQSSDNQVTIRKHMGSDDLQKIYYQHKDILTYICEFLKGIWGKKKLSINRTKRIRQISNLYLKLFFLVLSYHIV